MIDWLVAWFDVFDTDRPHMTTPHQVYTSVEKVALDQFTMDLSPVYGYSNNYMMYTYTMAPMVTWTPLYESNPSTEIVTTCNKIIISQKKESNPNTA